MAVPANYLDVYGRIDPPRNFRCGSCAGDDGHFTRGNASGCMKRFGYEKISRDIALTDIFLESRGDGVVTVRLHRNSLSLRLKWIVPIQKFPGSAKDDSA